MSQNPRHEERKRYDFFLAHSGAETPTAERFHDLLSPHSRAYLDSRCLKPGDDWDLELPAAHQNSYVTIVLISAATPQAFYQREEIARALALAREDSESHRVVPVYLDELSPAELKAVPYGLRIKQAIRLSAEVGLEAVAARLLALLDLGSPSPSADRTSPTIGEAPERRGGIPATPLLHGRETERAEVERILENLKASSSDRPPEVPQLVLLAGESGVGKSALAKLALKRAFELGFGLASSVCEPFHEGMSFFPVREVIRQLVRKRSAAEEVARCYGAGSFQAQMAQLAESHDASPAQRRDALIATFVNVLFAPYRKMESGRQPSPRLVFLDDLDGVDAGTADALLCFLSRAREGPVLVLGAYRTDLVTNDEHPLRTVIQSVRRAGDRAAELELQALPQELIPQVAEAILGGTCSFPSRFHQRLFEETEGNPLFLREILRSLARREDRLQFQDDRWILKSEPEQWSIPRSVEEVISARLDLLDSTLRETLEIAAVVGRQFSFEAVAELTGTEESELLDQLQTLLDLDVINERGDEGEIFEFCHGKIRDVLYSSMPRLRRKRIHGRVARVQQTTQEPRPEDMAAVVGEHLYLAGEYSEAFPILLKGARNAMELHSGFEAAALYSKARTCGERRGFPADEPALEVRLEEIDALKLSNDYERAELGCHEVIAQAEEPLTKGWALNHLGDIHWTLGESAKAAAAHEEAEGLARRLDNTDLLLETVADLCELHDREAERLAGIDPERVARHRELSRKYLGEQQVRAEEVGGPEARSRAWRNLAKRERREGNLDRALVEYERALAVREPNVSTHSVLISYAKTLRFVGRYDDARQAVERVLDWSRQTGARRSLAIALQYRGIVKMEMGAEERSQAKADLERALELHEEIGYARGRRETAILLGEWFLLAGEEEEALDRFRYALDSEERDGEELIRIVAAQLEAMTEDKRRARLLACWEQRAG